MSEPQTFIRCSRRRDKLCELPGCNGLIPVMTEAPFVDGDGDTSYPATCYRLDPPHTEEIKDDRLVEENEIANAMFVNEPQDVPDLKIGKAFPFITYCDPESETLRMNVKMANGTFSEVTLLIHGKERWHYILQFHRAKTNRISLKPFKKGVPINLSLVFRDNKGYNHKQFYRYTRTTGGTKAKYWLEQTQLKHRTK